MTREFNSDYVRDRGISGIVAISDGRSRSLSSNTIRNAQAPFAIHSIGKVFTGVLLLRLIEDNIIPEGALDRPIQLCLSEEVIQKLSPVVRDQLARTTLREVMLHQGRYGDYLDKYMDAISRAIAEGRSVPKIHRPQDFLAYADEGLVELGPNGSTYSNLGILLVGFAIEHLYHQSTNRSIPYQEILKQYLINPAGIQMFQTEMPSGARVNPADPIAPHIVGGPAGGYWTTANDMLRFGDWLGQQCKREPFMRLVQLYGGEFLQR